MEHKYPSSNCFSSQLFQTFKEIAPILQDFFQMMEKEIPLTHFQGRFTQKKKKKNQIKALPRKG